ncbi:MAG: hypothetical protein VYA51_08155 [Planctomycetota bacterium]|nr:hypothetical protein [Planctomycetota bacterium]
MQSGHPIQAPSTAPAGGTVDVTIQSSHREVWLDVPGEPYRLVKVPKSGKLTIAVPNAPGEVLSVSVVTGAVVKTALISIVAPSP